MASNDELACVYAALILMDDEVPITVEKINTILKAASVNVEPYWPGLFAKAVSGLDIRSLVANVGSGVGTGGGGGGGAPAAAAASSAPAAEAKKEEKEEEAEESDDDMGFSLFG
ncbi:60S acidic ribosomal protein P1-like [Penaeus japonicus]|uniref:60S acidic ribosomal protein P1-like n=1 Tax=Penaeus japonicus TaxID=27405 RepID=UPI001C715205|nr:60S acidic ribosomal protein P1-like [Penaeus japonicus]